MNIMKKLFFASIAICSAFIFSSCQNVIYANIRKEVALKEGTVAGSVRSIVRFKQDSTEYLYLANGGTIYRKLTGNNSYGGWEDMKPNIDGQIITLAADKDNLYALVGTWQENLDKGQIRWNSRSIYTSTNGSTWSKVKDFPTPSNALGSDIAPVFLFCTNSVASADRKAYYNYDGKGYTLNGTSAPDANTGADGKAAAVAGDHFFDAYSALYGAAACEGNGGVYYYSSGSTLKSSISGNSVSVGANIYSIAVTSDYILVGTESGIMHYHLDSNGKIGDKADFSTNADAIMTSSYEVNALLVTDPKKTEAEATIYAGVDFSGRLQQFDHICLWAYYPDRGHWNRD